MKFELPALTGKGYDHLDIQEGPPSGVHAGSLTLMRRRASGCGDLDHRKAEAGNDHPATDLSDYHEMKTTMRPIPKSCGKTKDVLHPFLLPGHRLLRLESESPHMVCKVGNAIIVRDNPGKSISQIELAWKIERDCKTAGRPVDELTRRWIEVPQWTDERERQEIQKFLRPNNDPMGPRRLSIRVSLNGSQAAAEALGSMAGECLDQLLVVADSIREDELISAHASIAAEELARVIGNACCKMNELARSHPRIFQRFSRKLWKWPIMKSTYPEFGDDELGLLAGLRLAEDLPLRLDSKAQWARWIKDDAGRFAWQLLWYVWRARSENNRWGLIYGDFSNMVDELPPLDKHSAPKWWKVAKAALLYSYPKPLEVAELAALVKGRRARRYPSRLEEAILSKLENRFLSFARKSSAAFPDPT
jgi:hypothetical protein